MKFGEACCALRNPGPGWNIDRLPCYTGIHNEKAIGKLDKSRPLHLSAANQEKALVRALLCEDTATGNA